MSNFIHKQDQPKGQVITDSKKVKSAKILESGFQPKGESLNKKKKGEVIHV